MPPPHLTTSFPVSPDSFDDDEPRDEEDEQSDVLSPFHRSMPGTLDMQLNGKQRNSIIEYIQREDEPSIDDNSTDGLPHRSSRDGQDSDDEEDEQGEASRGVRLMDPFYRELERAEEERKLKKDDEKDVKEEQDRLRELAASPPLNKAQDHERKRNSLLSSPSTTATSSRRNSASAAPIAPTAPTASNVHTASNPSTTPSRRMSRATDTLLIPGNSNHNSRAPSRSSLSANGGPGSTKQKPRMLAGRSGQTPANEREGRVIGLPAVVLVGNGGRRRLDMQLAMVRRSVEEVEEGMRRKMEREKEKDRERLAREQLQQQQLLQQSALCIQEEAEDEASDTVTTTLTTTHTTSTDDTANPTTDELQSSARQRSDTAATESGKELVVRTEGVLVKSEGGPFASILHNLSFANTLLPLTAEELAMTSSNLTSPTSPHFPPLSRALTTVSASAPVSPRPLFYQSCFPSWLSSRPDFSAFVGQHQLLCLHLAEKERDKRSVKDLAKLSEFFLTFPFFHKFSPHTLTELSRCCSIERRKRGERVDSKSEEGSVMRFVYEGEVTYETSIARLFKRKRKEREREQKQKTEKERREAEKLAKERERQKEKDAIATRARGGSKNGRLAAAASTVALPSNRGRSASQTLAATLPLPANSIVPGPSPPPSQGGGKPSSTRVRTNSQSTADNNTALRSRSNTSPATAALPLLAVTNPAATSTLATSAASSQRSSIIAPSNAILSHALTYDPNDHTQALPVIAAASPSASSAPAFALDSSLDELLVTHKLSTGETFGHSLLFEHLFASFSFSQIYRIKQQQRLHAILSRNINQRGWGTARQLVRSLLEQKSSLHIHSVEVVSDECLFFCWQHTDLEAIAKESRRFDTNEMVGALRVLPFFTNWPFSTIQDTAARAESRTMKRGDWLVHEGEPTNSLFFVVRGEVEAVKHCSLIQAERWPAGAHKWEVTKTQRVKAYPVGRLGEGEVVGVEGVCGVSTRDFSVRVVSATCVVYVVKRVAFAGWSGMKKVMRDCHARMMEWRERATQQVQMQAGGKHSKQKTWQQQQEEIKANYAKRATDSETETTDETAAIASQPQASEQQEKEKEEEKVQLESDRSHTQHTDYHAHQQQTSSRSHSQSAAQSRMSTTSHRQAPLQSSGRLTVTDSNFGDESEEQAEERRQRRKRLKEEEAARVRRGTQRNEDYWLDRVLTVERMQEDKARRRKLALRRHDDDTAVKPASRQQQQQDEQLVEAVRLTGELPLLTERQKVMARRKSSGAGSGGIRVERHAAAINLHQRRAIVDRTLDSQRWETAMSAVVQLHFDPPT